MTFFSLKEDHERLAAELVTTLTLPLKHNLEVLSLLVLVDQVSHRVANCIVAVRHVMLSDCLQVGDVALKLPSELGSSAGVGGRSGASRAEWSQILIWTNLAALAAGFLAAFILGKTYLR